MNLNDFIKDCESRGLTRHTIQTYSCNLKVFLSRVRDPLKVDTNILRDFLDYLKKMDYIRGTVNLKGVCSQTINAYFAAISTYYDFLIYSGNMTSNPVLPFRKRYLMKNKRQYNGENSRQLISIAQMKQLINQDMPIQHKLILLLLAKTGVRRGELLSIDIHDIIAPIKKEIVLKAKAKRTNRLILFDDETAEVLKVYLKWREPRAKCPALLISPYGKRMKKTTPNDIVAFYGQKVGLHDPHGPLNRKLTPHAFRHWFTTHLRKAGMPREFIQELRGDSRNQTIDIYDHLDMSEIREAYNDCMPSLIEGTVTLHVRDALPQKINTLSFITRIRLFEESTATFGETTIGVLSILKETSGGMTPIQITRQIKKPYDAVRNTAARQVKAGRLSRDEAGKYSITPKGIETLGIILNKFEINKNIEVKKPEIDRNKQLLDYIIQSHPELVNDFFNEIQPQK